MRNHHCSRISILYLVFGLFLASCGGGLGGESQEILITDEDNDGQVELKQGETIILSLVSNPTTGYSWQLMGGDETLLPQEGEPVYEQDPEAQGLVGGGGTETFRFTAIAEGEVTLQLGYARPWESVPPIETFSIEVVIK